MYVTNNVQISTQVSRIAHITKYQTASRRVKLNFKAAIATALTSFVLFCDTFKPSLQSLHDMHLK